MKSLLFLLTVVLYSISAVAQFPPQAGVAGSTAVDKNSNLFVGWANTCRLKRGWMDIANKPGGYASTGDSTSAVDAPDGYIVSLGDSGIATLTFEAPIYNGPGFDFAIFENGFGNPSNPEEAFLELAFVEVSSDGINFFRFPATSLTPEIPQIPVAGVYMNARNLNNLAGKYIGNYGTPFDLDELSSIPGLDVNHITHIRLVDVIGSTGANASLDKDGRKINDPYPTNIPTGGFDVDAVGAFYMYGRWPSEVRRLNKAAVCIYPNPASDKLAISADNSHVYDLIFSDIAGKILERKTVAHETVIDITEYARGIYFLYLVDENGSKCVERIVKQ
jgi:hypothetical protein